MRILILGVKIVILSGKVSILGGKFSILGVKIVILDVKMSILSGKVSILSGKVSILGVKIVILSGKVSILSGKASILEVKMSILTGQARLFFLNFLSPPARTRDFPALATAWAPQASTINQLTQKLQAESAFSGRLKIAQRFIAGIGQRLEAGVRAADG